MKKMSEMRKKQSAHQINVKENKSNMCVKRLPKEYLLTEEDVHMRKYD